MTDMVFGSAPTRNVDPVLPRWWRTLDKWTLACVLALFAVGLLLGLAASVPLAERNELQQFHYVKRQMLFGSMAIVVMLFVSMQSVATVRRLAILGFAAAMVALMLLPVLGTDFGRGATRGYSLGFISLQPSEFLKPVFVIVAAWLMSTGDASGVSGRLLSFCLTLLVVAFLVIQPDFGQSALVLFSWGVMWFVSGASVVLLVSLGAVVVAGGVLAYSTSEHFARRIDGFLAPEVEPTTQLGYATGAIQNGGLFGVGVGEGTVKNVLPDAHTDFIIAVAAEEYGLLLVVPVIALFCTVVVRSLRRLTAERDPFVRLAGTGLACAFGVQAIINMGVAVRLLPAKGMTLPFVSYGGSSLIAGGVAIGCLLALTRARPQGQIADIVRGRI